MTLQMITTIKRFIGQSGDVKPTGCPAGSTLYEADTGDTYVFDGTNWVIRK